MRFEELLAEFKERPRRASVALLLDDPLLFRAVVMFKLVPIRRLDDWLLDSSWEALWDCVEVDVSAFAMLADVVEVEARKMLARLKGLRLVYPDGTVQEQVDKLIEKRLNGLG